MEVVRYQSATDYLDVKEISLSTGFADRTVRGWLKRGLLPYIKLSGRYMVPVRAYLAFLDAHSYPKLQTEPNRESGNSGARIAEYSGPVTHVAVDEKTASLFPGFSFSKKYIMPVLSEEGSARQKTPEERVI